MALEQMLINGNYDKYLPANIFDVPDVNNPTIPHDLTFPDIFDAEVSTPVVTIRPVVTIQRDGLPVSRQIKIVNQPENHGDRFR